MLNITDALDYLLVSIAEKQKVVNGITDDILKSITTTASTAERAPILNKSES